jgi:hypothetical protein
MQAKVSSVSPPAKTLLLQAFERYSFGLLLLV